MRILILLTVWTCFTHSAMALVSKAKVTELASHRIDRLVTLNKIDSSFLNRLSKLEVSIVENQNPVFYQVIATQNPNAAGNPLRMALLFDEDGKPLSFQVFPHGSVGEDQQWPDKD